MFATFITARVLLWRASTAGQNDCRIGGTAVRIQWPFRVQIGRGIQRGGAVCRYARDACDIWCSYGTSRLVYRQRIGIQQSGVPLDDNHGPLWPCMANNLAVYSAGFHATVLHGAHGLLPHSLPYRTIRSFLTRLVGVANIHGYFYRLCCQYQMGRIIRHGSSWHLHHRRSLGEIWWLAHEKGIDIRLWL